MGRAYPVSWQTTPVVFEKKAMMIPTCISDGNGRIIVKTLPIHHRITQHTRQGIPITDPAF